jgi:hypothetical protein
MPSILVAIFAVIMQVVTVCREFRKTAAFVITAAVWACFLWLFAIIGERVDSILADMDSAHAGGAVTALSSLMDQFDKLEYMFPVYTAFRVLALYCSCRLTALLLHYLFRIWDAVPFKGSAGA